MVKTSQLTDHRTHLHQYCIKMAPIILILATLAATSLARVAPLANCPIRCQCDDDTLVVRCGEGHLDVLPIALNPSIQQLVIKNNKIKTIDSSIQFYAELNFLDLSYNHLFSIPGKTFNYQKKLQELHLNHNKIGSISNKTFTGLATLTILNLRGNFIDELAASVFATLPKLEELNLGQNRLTTIDAKAFDGLNSLRVLYLDDNTLTSIPSPSFVQIPALAELFLGINSFTAVGRGSFENLRSLNRLDLHGANLFNISLETFRGLENVRILDLSDNRLRRIPTVELSTLTRLEELNLGQNDFTVIPEGAFVGMTNLRRLDISGSLTLAKVQAAAFSANTNLESITLTSNKELVDIQEGAFGGLPHLKHVILRDNALTTLTEGLFPWSELSTFDLSENPITCDCRVMWLRNLLIAQNASQTQETVFCASPERLREEPLKALSPELLGCAHLESRHQAMLGVILVISAAFITALMLILYKCRSFIWEAVKGRWSTSALGRKEREYQKTFTDEEYARFQHPCSLSVHPSLYNYPQLTFGARSIPVTEL